MSRWRALAAPVVVALLTGLLIYRLWPRLGLPALGSPGDAPFPGLWRAFFAIWLPALFPTFTALHLWLARAAGDGPDPVSEAARRGLGWDRGSYLGLALFVGAMLVWRRWEPWVTWRLVFGGLYVGLLFAKTLGLVVALYRVHVVPEPSRSDEDDAPSPGWTADEARGAMEGGYAWMADDLPVTRPAGPESADPPALPRLLFWTAFVLYAFLAPYVVTAMSTAGDEHVYLLTTESLRVDHDVDIGNNVGQGDYTRFYWGRAAPDRWHQAFRVFGATLLPGYALGTWALPRYPPGGRLGATWTIALFGALLGVQVFRLCRELGLSRGAAMWGWMVLALTPPVVTNANHIYPELPAAWALVWSLRALRRIRTRPRALTVVATGIAFLVGLKSRFVSLGAGLLAGTIVEVAVLPWARFAGLAGVCALAFLYLAGSDTLQTLATSFDWRPLRPAAWLQFLSAEGGWRRLVAALGILADQEFGLLFYAPQFVLAVVGLPLLARRRPRACLALVGLFGFYFAVLVQYRWIQWDAGWTPPPRFILSVTPLLVPLVGEVFDHWRGRALATLNTVWLVWTTGVALALAVVPFWRYNGLTGRSTLLLVAGQALGLDVARFLPSLRAPTAWTWIVLMAGALGLAGATGRSRRRPVGHGGWGIGAVLLAPRAALVTIALVALTWLGAAAVVPTWHLEAEAMQHSGGIEFGSYATQPILWVFHRDGELWEPIVTWPGRTRVTIEAAGLTTTGTAPKMTLLVDGQAIRSWRLDVGGQGTWKKGVYTASFPTRFGHPVLTLRITDAGERRLPAESPRLQHVYVDSLEIAWSRSGG
jgi:hypothetical protein